MEPGTIVCYGGCRYLLVKPVDNRREWLVERMRDQRIMRMKVAQVKAAMGGAPGAHLPTRSGNSATNGTHEAKKHGRREAEAN